MSPAGKMSWIALGIAVSGCLPTNSAEAPSMDQPPPFLALPLAKNVSPLKVSQGWLYSEDEKSIHPDIPTHYAVDFPVAWGTEVYAPADGMAVASYHTYDMTDSKGRIIGYGLGLFIQIWHEGPQLYSLYAHLSGVNDKLVPYMAPTLEGGNWQPRKALYVPIEEFKKNAKPVKRGDLIGHAGYTGLRLGYDETPANPVSVDPKKDKTWDPHGSHLHWEVYTRTPDGGAKDKRYDPFGLYAEKKQYAEVFQKAQGLILANPDGSPQCAR